ncbi:MAG TPA: NTP transferase domain-containing protein [Acidimicrobiia bacterium]
MLLTGGASRRMATDKATIVWRGETLAARAARVLAAACDPVIEVGSGASELNCVREDPPGSGPLAALLAGARAMETHTPVVLLACDLPFVELPILRLLVDWPGAQTVIPVVDGRLQYACARYGSDALERAEAARRAGEHSLQAAAGDDHDELSESQWRAVGPANTFADVDTPADLRRLGLS